MDPPAPGLPPLFAPMLPTLVYEPFDSPDHLFEVKWDGVRVLAFCDSSATRLYSRSGREVTHQYPEFEHLHRRLKFPDAVLDGEIVALDPAARPSFELLQQRINLSRPSDVQRGVRTVAVDLVLFDLPFVSGRWIGGQPLTVRLDQLAGAVQFGESVLQSEPIADQGIALFRAAAAKGLEGVVGKHQAGHYIAGRRTRDWLKIKAVHDIDCVIGGYSAGTGHRSSSMGALLLGAFDADGRLRYLGSVGTGFDGGTLGVLMPRLRSLQTDQSPFDQPIPAKGITWVRPQLVCRVEYRQMTSAGKLRAPAFKGLRSDKPPDECLAPG